MTLPRTRSNSEAKSLGFSSGFGASGDKYMDSFSYLKSTPKMFEHIRNKFGDSIELLHDIHERVRDMNANGVLASMFGS